MNQELLLRHGGVKISTIELSSAVSSRELREITVQSGQDLRAEENQFDVFSLEGPPRLVVDLTGVTIPGGKVFKLEHDQLFDAVRFGVQPRATRIVFDIRADSMPAYKTLTQGNKLRIQFGTPTHHIPSNEAQEQVSPPAPPVAPSSAAIEQDLAPVSVPASWPMGYHKIVTKTPQEGGEMISERLPV